MPQYVVLLAARLKKRRWEAAAEATEEARAAMAGEHVKCMMQPAVTAVRPVKCLSSRGSTRQRATQSSQFIVMTVSDK